MKLFDKKEIIPLFVILIMLLVGAAFYNSGCLPDKLPTHWNIKGEVDGYGSKGFVLLFFPLLTLALYVLMLLVPLIDPLRKNYQKFKKAYFFIRLLLILFFAALYFYTFLAAMGTRLGIKYFMIPLLSLLFIGLGEALPQIKRNYFAGIRTPWTLNSDIVWQKTHQFAGKTFMAAGLVSLLALFTGQFAFWVFMVIIIAGALLPVAYSYWIYRQLGLFKK